MNVQENPNKSGEPASMPANEWRVSGKMIIVTLLLTLTATSLALIAIIAIGT